MTQFEPLGEDAGLPEVERGSGDGCDGAERDQVLVDGEVAGARDPQHVVEDGAAALAGEVEVGVVGEVDDGGRVGDGPVLDAQLAAGVEQVGDLGGQRTGEALVPGGAVQAQPDADPAFLPDGFAVPQPGGVAVGSAVQGVAGVLGGESVDGAVQGQQAAGDPVGVAADGGAEVGGGAGQFGDAHAAEDDVGAETVPVGRVQGVEPGAEAEHLGEDAAGGPEGPAGDRPAVGEGGDLGLGDPQPGGCFQRHGGSVRRAVRQEAGIRRAGRAERAGGKDGKDGTGRRPRAGRRRPCTG